VSPHLTDPGSEFAAAALLDLLPDAVVLVGPDARIRWGNPAAERMFASSVEQVRGSSALELLHPDDLEFALRALDTVQGKEAGSPIEIRVRAAEGWRLVELIGAPVGDGDIVLCVRDLTERRRYEIASGEEDRFRSLVHNAGAITMLLDPDGIVTSASAAITRLTGHDLEPIHDRPLHELLASAGDRERLTTALRTTASGSTSTIVVDIRRFGDAGTVPIEFSITNLADDPTVGGFVLSGHNVAERIAAEREVARTLSLLTATLDSTTDGILVVDRHGRISSYNRRFVEMWHIPDAVLEAGDDGSALAFVVGQLADPEAFRQKVEELYADPEAESYDTIGFDDGRVFERFSRPQWVEGEVVGRVWSFRDLTERKHLEDELVYRAFHDQLTGLPNKARFCDRLQHAVERSQRDADGFAVLFLDLDNFKTVNDSLGHLAGDRLLVAAAQILSECLRAGDTAARLGGDEFAILLEHVTDLEVAEPIARRIRDAFRRPLALDDREVTSTVSIGIAFGGGRSTTEQILRNADLAMYLAKSRGKNRFERYEESQHQAAVIRVELETELHRAIQREEFRLAYQPIVHSRTGAVRAVEALARWAHPTRGELAPAAFMAIAEEAGLMDDIGRMLLRSACHQAQRWRDGPAPDLAVSVNVSPRQLAGETIVDDVASALADAGLAATGLVVEITETAMLHDTGTATANLQALDELGIRLALDDFGTGYSSLTYLQQFPIDIVKIDKSFVAMLTTEQRRRPLAPAIIELAHHLELVTVAEGVETPAQLAQLRALGCDLLQGYLLHPPLPADEITALLAGDARAAAS